MNWKSLNYKVLKYLGDVNAVRKNKRSRGVSAGASTARSRDDWREGSSGRG